jgi:hypothetical protein
MFNQLVCKLLSALLVHCALDLPVVHMMDFPSALFIFKAALVMLVWLLALGLPQVCQVDVRHRFARLMSGECSWFVVACLTISMQFELASHMCLCVHVDHSVQVD